MTSSAQVRGRYASREHHPKPVLMQMWLPPRGRTINDCLNLGRDAALVIDAVLHGEGVTREAVLDLVRAGRADLLLGQREDQHLDVKRERYLPWDDKAKFELAKDVAAMANGGGGALVIGLGSSPHRQGDVISMVNPVPYDHRLRRQMQDVIRHWLHPVPARVQVEIHDVPSAGPQHGIVLVNIPGQLEELLPILVRRGAVNGRMSEMHVAFVQRDGEETILFDAPSLHSLLSAGRAALNVRRESQVR
jgi:Putative DNA-binding domain